MRRFFIARAYKGVGMKARYFAFQDRTDDCQELNDDSLVILLYEQSEGVILFVDADSQEKIKIAFNTKDGSVNATDLNSNSGVTIIYHYGQITTPITDAMKRKAIFDLLLQLADLGDDEIKEIVESRHKNNNRYMRLDERSLYDTLNIILRESKTAYLSTVKPRTPIQQAFYHVLSQPKNNPIQQAIYEVLTQQKYNRECINSEEIVAAIIRDIKAMIPEQTTVHSLRSKL
jgi:hypothetical protein